ncbi:MAG TPA: hypothetical protein VHW25_14855 [Steroidobacteraceae bacterium]|jgi:hypothetical protein|nr:hypothetical protein [Steroidobacteraceae bacterium]
MTSGKTRSCPHCKATILESATVCPGCLHHLRFDPAAQRMLPAATPLRVEGTIRHPPGGGTWEYSIVLAVRNERGEEITRQVVGVGALAPADVRSFSLSVELFAPQTLARDPRTESRGSGASPGTAGSSPRPTAPAVSKSPFRDPRDPRTRPPMTARDSTTAGSSAGGPPALPRDPRPPALETHVRTRPAAAQPLTKDRPKD